jgi:hypothetical protein
MLQKLLIPIMVAALAVLLQSSPVQAWGGYHVGYTRVGPGGVQHYGRTAVSTPYGSYGGARYGAAGYGGARYGAVGYGGVRYGGAYGGAYGGYHYSPSYSGAAYGGVRVGGYYAR